MRVPIHWQQGSRVRESASAPTGCEIRSRTGCPERVDPPLAICIKWGIRVHVLARRIPPRCRMRSHHWDLMASTIAYWWRVAGTGLGFAAFGVSVLLLALVALPVSRWRSSSTTERQLRMQLTAHHGARIFLLFLERLGVMRLNGYQTERLREPGAHLVVANHPTLIDVLALLACMPQADCIVSGDRAGNWLLGGMVSACGYVNNDVSKHGAAGLVEACSRRLREGRSLIVFPEGTRSPRGGLHPFRRGAAHIALAAECALQPVVIQCDPPTLGKNEKWYDVPDRAFTLTVTVIDPISTKPIAESGATPPLAARRLTCQLREALVKGLNIVDVGNA